MNVIRNDKFHLRGMEWRHGTVVRAQPASQIPRYWLKSTSSQPVKVLSKLNPSIPPNLQAASAAVTASSSSVLSVLDSLIANTTKNNLVTPNGSSASCIPKTSSSDKSKNLPSSDINTINQQMYRKGSNEGNQQGMWSSKTPLRTPRRTPKPSSKTPTSSMSNGTDESSCIIAISEGRGQARGEVGIAALDTKHPHLILCQISDSQTYSNTLIKINVLNPIEIIVPHTFCEGQQQNKLISNFRDTFPNVTITTIQRRHFSDVQGLQQIKYFCAPEYSSVEMLVIHKFYALSAATALIKYVEHIQNMIFAPKSLKVEYQGSQNSTVIDVETAHRLELVRSLRGNATQHSLLGILNNCSTGGGTRLLRANILQPPCLRESIQARLDCVQEIVEDQNLYHNMQGILSKLSDVSRLLQLCMHIPQQDNVKAAEIQITYVLLLKTTLDLLPSFRTSLEDVHSEFLCSVRESLNDVRFNLMLQLILEIIHDDAHIRKGFAAGHMQRCFAVKPHVNGLLDVARKAYCELVDDITEIVNKLGEKYNLALRLNFTVMRGFHIVLVDNSKKKVKISDLPQEFIQVQRNRTSLTFTTQSLIHADERCKDVLNEIHLLSNIVVFKLLTDLREHIGCLYKLCENIAELDMLVSFAKISALSNYVRPEFGNVLDLKDSRHPILDFINPTTPIPNDVFSSVENNFHVITGPNMSGKSIYIRQILLLQIMAQLGCYIPATKAHFRLADHIFSRIGFDDSIESNASTFVLEVKEVQYIMQTLTPNSIVIMDELGRGTSSEEGTAIAWALSEELLQSNAFIFLTTHFLLLTKLEELYSNVTNIHFETLERTVNGTDHLIYTHCLQPGISMMENYGLRLAERLSMPDSIMERAKILAEQIAKEKKPVPVTQEQVPGVQLACELASALLSLLEEGNLTTATCHELRMKLLNAENDDETHNLEENENTDDVIMNSVSIQSHNSTVHDQHPTFNKFPLLFNMNFDSVLDSGGTHAFSLKEISPLVSTRKSPQLQQRAATSSTFPELCQQLGTEASNYNPIFITDDVPMAETEDNEVTDECCAILDAVVEKDPDEE